MEQKYIPLIIGGFIPALLYRMAGFLQKWSAREGATVSIYLIGFGLATFLAGVVYRVVSSEGPSPVRSVVLAVAAGLLFGVGAGLISFAIIRYDAAVSQLAPLYNLNTLVSVALGLLIFFEFREMDMPRLLAGTGVILLGGWLVSSA